MNDASLPLVLLFSLIGGIVSLCGGLLLLGNKKTAQLLARFATPFAAGALLAAVFLDLLPEGIEQNEPTTVLTATLIGILAFFFMERFLHWFHHHHEHPKKHRSITDPKVGLIILGDTLHNALDGVAIAASFLISVPTGIITTIAVATHEIPQEIGDFGLLLSRGLSRRRVLIVNIVSACITVVFATITFTLGNNHDLPIGVLLGVSAGFLLYIAMSDVIPTIHEQMEHKKRLFDWQAMLMFAGVISVALAIFLAHTFEASNGHDIHQDSHTETHYSSDIEHRE